MKNTTTAPAGFHTLTATTSQEAELSGDLHKGPAAGTVEATWSPKEGVLIFTGDSEGMDLAAARQLVADLSGVLNRIDDL